MSVYLINTYKSGKRTLKSIWTCCAVAKGILCLTNSFVPGARANRCHLAFHARVRPLDSRYLSTVRRATFVIFCDFVQQQKLRELPSISGSFPRTKNRTKTPITRRVLAGGHANFDTLCVYTYLPCMILLGISKVPNLSLGASKCAKKVGGAKNASYIHSYTHTGLAEWGNTTG